MFSIEMRHWKKLVRSLVGRQMRAPAAKRRKAGHSRQDFVAAYERLEDRTLLSANPLVSVSETTSTPDSTLAATYTDVPGLTTTITITQESVVHLDAQLNLVSTSNNSFEGRVRFAVNGIGEATAATFKNPYLLPSLSGSTTVDAVTINIPPVTTSTAGGHTHSSPSGTTSGAGSHAHVVDIPAFSGGSHNHFVNISSQSSPRAISVDAEDWVTLGPGTYTITVQATVDEPVAFSEQQSFSAASFALSDDLTPEISFISEIRLEGTEIVVHGSATRSSGSAEGLSYSWAVTRDENTFATGSGENWSFTPDDDGSYEISLTVSDEDGGSATVSEMISVANVAPTPSIVSIGNVRVEGTSIVVSGGATDPAGVNDTLSYAWSVTKEGVAYATGSGESWSFTPDDNGSYEIFLTVSDEDGGSTTVSETIRVANVAPILTISGPDWAVPGQLRTYTFTATDASPIDQVNEFTYAIDWNGDGVVDQVVEGTSILCVSHAFEETGTYAVTATVMDKDNGVSLEATRNVTASQALQINGVLYVGGTNGDDKIHFTPASGGMIQVLFNGTSLGAFQPTERIEAYGLAGNDDLQVAGGISLSSYLFGGAGHDRLKGGGGDDILVGGTGDDSIIGGGRRDLLIGGDGSDRIIGNNGDDILVAGYTRWDADVEALSQILRVWGDQSMSYTDRVSHLVGANSLMSVSGDIREGFGLLGTNHVADDNNQDVLTGSAGSDWFLFDSSGGSETDKATDLHKSETGTDLSPELLSDEDWDAICMAI